MSSSDIIPICSVEDCDAEVIAIDDGWEVERGIVCNDCLAYFEHHGHWRDRDPRFGVCVECMVENGLVRHSCRESPFENGSTLVSPGDECRYCGTEVTQ